MTYAAGPRSEWYRIDRIPKRSGGWREILVPRRTIWHWVRQEDMVRWAAEVVGELSRAAGVGEVAHGFRLGRSPVTLVRYLFGGGSAQGLHLIEYDLVDAFGSVAQPLARYVGRCGDVPWPGMLARAARGRPVWVDGHPISRPPIAVPGDWPEEPETWAIPHVMRGWYTEVGGGRCLDLVTGLERHLDGRPTKIWQGAPLAPYTLERYMIPLDWLISREVRGVKTCCYFRYVDRLFFVVHGSLRDHVRQLVENTLGELGLAYRPKRVALLGRRRVVILGLSVDPASGSMRLAERTRRRLRSLAHAERTKGPLTRHQRRVLRGLRALEAAVARQ